MRTHSRLLPFFAMLALATMATSAASSRASASCSSSSAPSGCGGSPVSSWSSASSSSWHCTPAHKSDVCGVATARVGCHCLKIVLHAFRVRRQARQLVVLCILLIVALCVSTQVGCRCMNQRACHNMPLTQAGNEKYHLHMPTAQTQSPAKGKCLLCF